MRTFLNHIKNETLDEIKTSLENFWQRMIQLSEFFQYSFMLILNGSVWLELAKSAARRVVLLQLLSIHDRAVGVTNLDVMLLWLSFSRSQLHVYLGSGHFGWLLFWRFKFIFGQKHFGWLMVKLYICSVQITLFHLADTLLQHGV